MSSPSGSLSTSPCQNRGRQVLGVEKKQSSDHPIQIYDQKARVAESSLLRLFEVEGRTQPRESQQQILGIRLLSSRMDCHHLLQPKERAIQGECKDFGEHLVLEIGAHLQRFALIVRKRLRG
eukprot:TRINITY_DN9503_c0_g1_i1.p1 TRINITY_DN9503_c0_g1~~TRINITY_DN9503_c0_g1_i1.p1  ORF type:complete len:122 (-),score=20.92 TRINITY_DN9503_c0_g1_i1:229-594(-)